jgi:hypothetical protein
MRLEKRRLFSVYFMLSIFETALVLVILLVWLSGSENAWLLGYSAARFSLLLGVLVLATAILWLSRNYGRFGARLSEERLIVSKPLAFSVKARHLQIACFVSRRQGSSSCFSVRRIRFAGCRSDGLRSSRSCVGYDVFARSSWRCGIVGRSTFD